MARVCEEWFPLGSYPKQMLPGFFMEDNLKAQLDVLLKNNENDWDFTIIISAAGEVRVGKSVLAMQIGCYWTYSIWKKYNRTLPFDCKSNFVFDGQVLIEKGNYLGKHFPTAVLIFDEAGADLEGRKTMQTATQKVLDYFRECGQYNLLNILVIPEFFDLPKSIAMSRSIFLLDVYYNSDAEGFFERGYFKFYSRRNKKELYRKGRKELNYSVAFPNFTGKFDNIYTIDKAEYKLMKQEALKKRETKKVEIETKFAKKMKRCFMIAVYLLYLRGYTMREIAEKVSEIGGMTIHKERISEYITEISREVQLLRGSEPSIITNSPVEKIGS